MFNDKNTSDIKTLNQAQMSSTVDDLRFHYKAKIRLLVS